MESISWRLLRLHLNGVTGFYGVAQFFFLYGIPVNKIPYCCIAVISNTTVCDVCASKPTVFGKMKLCAVLRHGQNGFVMCLLCGKLLR